MTSLKSYLVWDRTTRWFHWINFMCVVALAALGIAMLYGRELGIDKDGRVLLKTTHVWFGYVFAVNLGWRIAWAFFGKRQARWPAIFPVQPGFGTALRAYVRGLFLGDGRPYLGHNPVGRLMVTLLMVLLFVQAITGLVLAGTDIYYPPFGYWFASWIAAPGIDPSTLVPYDKTGIDRVSSKAVRAFREPFAIVHYWNFYALLFLILIHVVGVVVAELREGGGLVSAMFTGRKVFDRKPVDDV